MKRNRRIIAAVCGLLALVLLFSVGATSIFASDTQAGTRETKPGFRQKIMGHRGNINNAEPANIFDKLITDGVITQEQADKISAYLDEKAGERKAEFEKFKNMTAEERKAEFEKFRNMTVEERKAYFETNKPQGKPGLLDTLVTEGLLTQEKADEIAKLLPAKKDRPAQYDQRGPMMRGPMMRGSKKCP